MSSCLSGGRAYGFELDKVVKPSSPTSSSRSTHSSSPSSTLSEACNSPLAISTKRARGPRKRPNQTYNEAAALLSTAYPTVFSVEPVPARRHTPAEPVLVLREPTSRVCWLAPAEPRSDDDFDAESILDEEAGEGMDSIMGNLSFCSSAAAAPDDDNPMLGLLKLRQGLRRAMKRGDEGEWWRTPAVEVAEIAPPRRSSSPEKKKKKKKAVGAADEAAPPPLGLRLNCDDVARAWSGRGSPFSDSSARGERIELFPEGGGGVREASVMRYKEKRRSRLFSKKIRYQVRKLNADRRPRMKASGRFVRRPSLAAA